MRVLVRVARASVWVPSPVLKQQEGFLALVRTPHGETKPRVAYGRLDQASELGSAAATQTPRWLLVSVRWNDARVAEASPGDDAATFVEIVLFVLSRATRPRDKKPPIAFVASATLQLQEKDLAAVDASQEIVFRASLDTGYGSVEVAVKRADGSGQETTRDAGAFSVQWTSSEALERDLARQEASRREAEQELLERLVAVETKAKRLRELRDQAVELLRRKRAALAIQRAYRALGRRRKELMRQRRREQEAKEQVKKAALRAKVVERNKRRTQQLLDAWTKRVHEDTHREEPVADVSEWVESETRAAQTKLSETRARLEAERDRKLQALHSTAGASAELRGEQSSRLLSDSLIHAVQQLHCRK